MNVDVDTDDEINLIKDVRARCNACYKCGEMGHFQRDCKYDSDKPTDGQQEQDGSSDSYDPVVGKWMMNLVATTPITAKAMKSLYAELNRQKDLKRTYRRRYKDLQAVVATTTDTPATISCPTIVTGSLGTLFKKMEQHYHKGFNAFYYKYINTGYTYVTKPFHSYT